MPIVIRMYLWKSVSMHLFLWARYDLLVWMCRWLLCYLQFFQFPTALASERDRHRIAGAVLEALQSHHLACLDGRYSTPDTGGATNYQLNTYHESAH